MLLAKYRPCYLYFSNDIPNCGCFSLSFFYIKFRYKTLTYSKITLLTVFVLSYIKRNLLCIFKDISDFFLLENMVFLKIFLLMCMDAFVAGVS